MEYSDKMGRLNKDIIFMEMCFILSKRSIDTSSKCGCVVVHKDGAILSVGYNNPVRGANDHSIPIEEYPIKYHYMEHSERNAIYNAARHGICLRDSIFYITGFPCIDCFRAIIQVGACKIVYGPNQTKMHTDIKHYEKNLENQNIVIERFKFDDILLKELPYIGEILHEKRKRGIYDISFEYNV